MKRRDFIIGAAGMTAAAALGGAWFVNRPEFVAKLDGERLARILASPNFVDGKFQCLEPVENIIENDESRISAWAKFLFGDKSHLQPKEPMVSQRTEFAALGGEDAIIWMGHSSFYIQAGGKKILTDPVFSSYASPLFFINKAFRGSNVYTAGDILDIDALIISHDHWDHLDYPTILAIKDKVKSVVCPLGVGGYLENWGYDAKIINEGDWFSEVNLGEDFSISILPSQHFSGRFLTPNKTLWASFAIKCGRRQIYFSGDGGYGAHFKKIGREFGGFDAALMENGQYNKSWHRIHLMPNETAQAAEDLNAKAVIPAHSGKFALARHAWDEPYRALCKESEKRSYKLLTPRIGEAVYIGKDQQLTKWWEEMA